MTQLTLTFDNGPWSDGGTDAILDSLAKRNLKATFFVVGNRLADPSTRRRAERAHAEGHWIGNHTLSHSKPLGLFENSLEAVDEIRRAEDALGELAHPDRFFRPPGKGRLGHHLLNRPAADYLQAQHYTVVTWNNVPRDWEDQNGEWVDTAIKTALAQTASVLVVHDHHMKRMPGTLERFLDQAAENNIEIVQEMPVECTPLIKGIPTDLFEQFIS